MNYGVTNTREGATYEPVLPPLLSPLALALSPAVPPPLIQRLDLQHLKGDM